MHPFLGFAPAGDYLELVVPLLLPVPVSAVRWLALAHRYLQSVIMVPTITAKRMSA